MQAFQSAVRGISSIYIGKKEISHNDYLKIVRLTPFVKQIAVEGDVPVKILRRWSQLYGRTLISLSLSGFKLQQLDVLSRFPSLECLSVNVRIQTGWAARLRKYTRLTNVKRLEVVLTLNSIMEDWEAFLDLFPYLISLSVWTCHIADFWDFIIRHPTLEYFDLSGSLRPALTIDCPKLDTLVMTNVPTQDLIFKSMDSLRTIRVGRYEEILTMDEDFPLVQIPRDGCNISHLECPLEIGVNLAHCLLKKSSNVLETLVVHSMRPLTLIKATVKDANQTFEFPWLRELTVNEIDEDWYEEDEDDEDDDCKNDESMRDIVPEPIERLLNTHYLELQDWLFACPSLRFMRFRMWPPYGVRTQYLNSFMAGIRNLKNLFPYVTFICDYLKKDSLIFII